jgi:Flp pilus assembly protein TadB
MRLPFFIPQAVAGFLSKPFSSFALYFSKMFPKLGPSLKTSGVEMDEITYIRISLFNAIIIGLSFGILFYLLSIRFDPGEFVMVWGSVLTGVILFILYFSYLMLFPFWNLHRKAEEIDSNLLFAIRHLVVQTSAGVPLFDAISSASSGYGRVSDEFSRIVTQVNGGKDLADTLEASAERSSSVYYRRIMWQVSNSARAGYATADILTDLMAYLTQDQTTRLKKFGSELNILSIFYLSMCIILPTFGLIFIIIMSSFSLIVPNTTTLSLIIFFVALFNLIFLGMIKSRRPAGIL